MRIKICFHLICYIIFSNKYYFTNAIPLIGENVKNAKKSDYPFAVSLMRLDSSHNRNEEKHLCTGSLITRRDVAISAHCIEGEDLEGLQIHYGSVDLRKGIKTFLFWWLTYEHWAVRKRMQLEFDINDVANLRLTEKVPNGLKPVKLGDYPNSRVYGKKVKAVGWGWQHNDELTQFLKTVELTVLTNDDCVARISQVAGEYLFLDPRHALCTTSQPYAILTFGDSGGPLLYNDRLIGISKGACPNSVDPSNPMLVNLHMSVYYFKQFLLETIQEEQN